MLLAMGRPHRSARLRIVLGLGVSALFMAFALARTDLDTLGRLGGEVAPILVGVAAAVSLSEVAVRAVRWTVLLSPMATVPVPVALAYLGVGHLANAVLPARLGDIARAYLAGGRLEMSRMSVLGTIATERIADSGLLLFVGGGAIVVGQGQMFPSLTPLLIAGAGIVVLAGIAALAFGLPSVVATSLGRTARELAGKFVRGASALRRGRTLVPVLVLTGLSFLLATLIMQAGAAAAGLSLAPLQAALIIAAVTLSTAIPAGPASIGTYEFVGVTVMTAMGFPAERAFLSIVLVHVIATLVPALIGLVGMWVLGIRHLVPADHASNG